MNLEFFRKKDFVWFIFIAIIFVALRLPAVHNSYHQDEYKWAYIVNTNISSEVGRIPHPPVGEFIYRSANNILGNDNLRLVPLVFSFVNLFLLFYLAMILFGRKVALWITLFFSISFYSVLASLMVDTDGAIMPMFFLIMAISYMKLRKTNFQFKISNFQTTKWLIVFVLAGILGFLIKVSFVVFIGAFVLDFVIEKKILSDKKRVFRFLGWITGIAVLLILILFVSRFIFPSFRLESSLKYWEHFVSFSGRGWFQTTIQFIKALLYSSPLLLAPLVFIDKEIFKKTRLFSLLIFVGLVFYLLLFDFSIGALDRYLQFLVIPLAIISGAIFSKIIDKEEKIKSGEWMPFIIIAVLIFIFQFLNHLALPLYPKTEWIRRVFYLGWSTLFPFMGGSGPTPFYISLGFIALVWIVCLMFVIIALKKIELRKNILIGVFIFGLLYNVVFAEEYLFGKINGNTSSLISNAVEFIEQNPDIKKVIVYNDNGGGEIVNLGKYRKRLYIDPKFDINEKIEGLNKYKEHYLVVNIPKIDPESVYAKYLNSCQSIYEETSGKISANIYDCSNAPDITNER
ncbi:MAG: hypothetical protein UR80_C0028G0004 [Parcubacteria group bacterium GW2011_GWB1_35_5]|uniref:Glycosyltransferase RgtA/B/C/D-like domain-containing protein n=1 Tax=Candidatus Zambryskibacteria bacterium RIFCSPLOWO2_01_FULL_35_19 TaxID=1802757 RepID=A0A1G2U039_9BACT|nr:MAG: hypothetical protein UR50_C0001G0023 [Parcubacteria group bacterium GW2011_GWC1_34_10]KKP80529.1 MAG: hypothetical protein UR80_C0028G0004 [Parcubacteria group bacterium GW2011_GWB1_35_5]OHA86492.1 MAG: hypothetical protein A2726_00245 [Candidatus Zambryskibacteria bacterium RIFCSPHIGHO2_01_FULL_35_32]OHB02172.1 MAG: hypothetical protein A3A90_02230 [Candidatus Zambryskibacteria bacterium RIFCSPLOWO2_01_FULL_35_19]